MPNSPFLRAKRHAERAIARGDIETATRWTNIMREHVWMARSIADLVGYKPRSKPRLIELTNEQRTRQATQHSTKTPPPSMPVMLNPDGYSPGGTPNWFLNHQRLERAGLPRSLAPPTQAELRRQKDAAP